MGGSLPFRSGVVVSLRPLSVCHGPMWLVPELFPSLSLSFPVCAHLLLGRDVLLLPGCGLRWPARLPPFTRVGAAPSTWVPLLWPGCVGFLPPCSFSSVFLRDVVTLSGH